MPSLREVRESGCFAGEITDLERRSWRLRNSVEVCVFFLFRLDLFDSNFGQSEIFPLFDAENLGGSERTDTGYCCKIVCHQDDNALELFFVFWE